MVRSKDPALKAALLERASAYAMAHGVAGLTLRPLAAEIGSTARMLLHHFGSKEQLVAEVLARIETDLGAALLADARPNDSLSDILLRFWDRLSDPALEPLLKSMFEVWGQALVRPDRYQPFLDVVIAPWVAFISERLRAAGRPETAARNLALAATAAFHGLELVRLTSGDAKAGRAALATLLDSLDLP